MSLIPYALMRPVLFAMDPEAAHDLTMQRLAQSQNTLLQAAWQQTQISDPITLAGLTFPNRVGLAAGLDKKRPLYRRLGRYGLWFCRGGHRHPKTPARQSQATHVSPA